MAAPTFVPDEVVTAAKLNSLPKGILGYAQAVANQTGISAEADLTGLSVAVTVEAARRIRVLGAYNLQQLTAAGNVIGNIKEGSTALGRCGTSTLAIASSDRFEGSVIITPTAGAHTYKLTLSTSGGTVSLLSSSTLPAYILVEDIGGV